MSGRITPTERAGVERGANLLVAIVPIALLAALSAPGPLVALVVTAAAAGASWALSRAGGNRAAELASIPLFLALGYGVVFVPRSLGTMALAGVAALGILYWLSRDAASIARAREVAFSLLFPAVALGLALASASFLPAPTEEVGVAAVLVVGVLVFLAWMYRTEALGMPAPPSGS